MISLYQQLRKLYHIVTIHITKLGIQFKNYGDIINSIVNGNVNDFYLGYLESFSKSQLKMANKSLKNKRNTKSEIDYYKNQKKIFIYLCDWFEKNPNPSVIVI